jgi:hypothetical protein
MFWNDVRFILGVAILSFIVPFSMILGIITTYYVVCNTITSCDNAGEVSK